MESTTNTCSRETYTSIDNNMAPPLPTPSVSPKQDALNRCSSEPDMKNNLQLSGHNAKVVRTNSMDRPFNSSSQKNAAATSSSQGSNGTKIERIQEKYPDRIPLRLLFKNHSLEQFAQKNLKSKVTMILKDLTVRELCQELTMIMKIPKTHIISLQFQGKSLKVPIRFQDSNTLHKVYTKVTSIQECRMNSTGSSDGERNYHSGSSHHNGYTEVLYVVIDLEKREERVPLTAYQGLADGQQRLVNRSSSASRPPKPRQRSNSSRGSLDNKRQRLRSVDQDIKRKQQDDKNEQEQSRTSCSIF